MRAVVAIVIVTFCSATSIAHADPITGHVVGPDGRPVANARIFVSHFLGAPQQGTRVETAFKVEKILTTDASGNFSADLPDYGKEQVNVQPGPKFYGIATVVAPGLAVAQGSLKAGENEFKLAKSAPVRGKVVDAAGKPVAKAIIGVRYFNPRQNKSASPMNQEYLNVYVGEEVAALFRTTTGADGTFTLNNLPISGIGALDVTNPEYAMAATQITVGREAPIEITVHPSAIITGRVVDESGKPVAGVTVGAQGRNAYGSAVSGADGTYKISHLSSGVVLVHVAAPKDEKVGVAQKDITITEGKTINLPDFVMSEGGFIEATVLDDDSGQPIPSGYIGINGPQFPRTNFGGWRGQQTGKDGKLRTRVVPGENIVQFGSSLPEYPNGGGAHEQTVTVKKGETATVTFRLKKGASVEGTVVGEDDKPIPGVHVRILNEWNNWEYERDPGAPSDELGRWKATGIPRDGQRLKVFVDGKYQVLSPEVVVLDQTRPVQQPIIVKVKASITRVADGRIVQPDGTPLAGVNINLFSYTKDENGNITGGGNNKNVVTDADGKFRADTIRPKETVQARPSFEGYRYLSGGEIKEASDGVHFSDIVMTPLTTQVTGRVINAMGKPVPGALVWSPVGYSPVHVLTDATGRFTLNGLPADGTVRVTAARGKLNSVVEMNLHGGKPETGSLKGLEMTLEASAPVDDLALADRLIENLRQNSTGDREWTFRDLLKSIARRDPERALRAADRNGKIKDEDRFAILEAFAQVDPAHAAGWGPAQCEKFQSAEWKCAGEGELAIAFATLQPELAGQLYDRAIAHLQESDSHDPYNSARLIAASALLKRGDEGHLMERLDDIKPQDWDKMRLAGVIGRGDLARAEVYIEVSKTTISAYGYAALIPVAAKTSPQTAKQYLDKMQKLVPAQDYSQALELIRAARRVIRSLGSTDPEAAATVAHSLPVNDQNRQQRGVVLAEAAAQQKGAAAVALWKEAADEIDKANYYNKGGKLAAIACWCRSAGNAPEAAKEIWQRAVHAMEEMQYQNVEDEMIFHAGLFDPALARMLADQTCESNNNAPPNARNSYPIAQAGAALASSDPKYGDELIDQAPDDRDGTSGKDWSRYWARTRLAQLLLLGPERRARLLFTDMNSGDNWERDLY